MFTLTVRDRAATWDYWEWSNLTKTQAFTISTTEDRVCFCTKALSKGTVNQPFYNCEPQRKMCLKSAWSLPTALLGVTGKYPATTQIKSKLLHSKSHWGRESGYWTDKTLCTQTNPFSKSRTQP